MRKVLWIVLLAAAAIPMFTEEASAWFRRQRRCRCEVVCCTPVAHHPTGIAEPRPSGPPIE
jgi:hypothetical protein